MNLETIAFLVISDHFLNEHIPKQKLTLHWTKQQVREPSF